MFTPLLFWEYSSIISAHTNAAVPTLIIGNPQIFASNDNIKKCDGSEADPKLPMATEVFSTEIRGS